MMKRLSKIALLAAAAFMLAGFSACSGDDEDERIDVTNLTVSPNEVTLYVNGDDVPKSATLTATVTPDNATDKTVKWLSSNTNVAEVSSETGGEITVTAKAAGTATITATAGDKKTATVQVTVLTDKSQNPNENPKEPPVEGEEEKTPPKEDVEEENPSKENVETAGTITLYKNGTSQGVKSSVAEALKAISITGNDVWKIELTKGTYNENGLNYSGTATVIIEGNTDTSFGSDVIIKGKGLDQTQQNKVPGRNLLFIGGSANLVLKNITLQNTLKRSDPDLPLSNNGKDKLTQAETLGFNSTGHVAAYNCSFKSHQDTIRTSSKAWFYKCYVEGDVDFIWMEGGTVGLYEDCKIHIVGDERPTEGSYVLAPKIGVSNKAGKGNVIYASSITMDDNVTKAYLFRNPWYSNDLKYKGELYNQGAVVDTTIPSNLHADLAYHDAYGENDVDAQYIGWKIDSKIADAYPNKLATIGTLDETTKMSEYSDRNYILNRVYNITDGKFENDSSSSIWDISALETEFSASTSQALPEETFDPTSVEVVWDLASVWKDDFGNSTIQSSTKTGKLTGTVEGSNEYTVKMFIDANANGQGGKFHSRMTDTSPKNDTQINAGTILTVPVTDGAIVSVTKNSGTFGIEGKETIAYTHSGAATGIVIYCTANGYLTEVAVSKLNLTALSDELKNATATGEVRAMGLDIKEATVMNGKTTTLKAIPYTSYGASTGTTTWTSSDTSVATVATGIVTVKAGTGTATIIATNNGHSASCTITAKATASWAEQAAENATWTPSAATPTVSNTTVVWENMVIVATTADDKFANHDGSYFKLNAKTSVVLYIPMTKNGTITINGNDNCSPTVKVGTSGTVVKKASNAWTYNYTTSEGIAGSTIGSMDGIEPTGTYAKIEFSGNGNTYCQTIERTY